MPTTYAQTETQTQSNNYLVFISAQTAAKPEWMAVAKALQAKYEGVQIVELSDLNDCAEMMKKGKARYAAFVARPEEIDYKLVNYIHRAARRIDDDLWGDCIWGIVTGYRAEDALRIAKDDKPLVIKRMLATTNVDSSRFEHSACITDWKPYQVMEQSGYQPPIETGPHQLDRAQRDCAIEAGIQLKFSTELAHKKPQLIVTSSHATEFNLEMPFGKGLIFSYANRYYQLKPSQIPYFAQNVLSAANKGDFAPLAKLAQQSQAGVIKPDGERRVWLAAGNCLFAHVKRSPDSMAVTALSAYGCNQLVGYTVPSWYGDGGWGSLSSLFSNTAGSSLAEAWYLNNQFILHKSNRIDPRLMQAEFNGSSLKQGQQLAESIIAAGIPMKNVNMSYLGVVHDRDVVALFGDPRWSATLDESHASSSLKQVWLDAQTLQISALRDHDERCAIWYPHRMLVSSSSHEGAVVTNDFLLIPKLKLSKGEQITIKLK